MADNRFSKIAIAAIGILVIAVSLYALLSRAPLPELEDMGIAVPETVYRSSAYGEPWLPGPLDHEGFALVRENAQFALLVIPDTTQIAVRNKRSGYVWRSNPPPQQLAAETAKGAVLANLQSPFILEYANRGKTQRHTTNALAKGVQIKLVELPAGIEVVYHYPELGLAFAIQYELSETGLTASIPDGSIQENGDAHLLSIQLLPYFGAVAGAAEDGYLFVPDGPGGLIYYRSERMPAGSRYDEMVYGDDPANLRQQGVPREAIAYPVFGLKRGTEAYAAIITAGEHTARITALPAGIQTTYHMLGAKFIYREEYQRKVSLSSSTVNTIQLERVKQDRSLDYRLLAGEEADYSGMAQAYRRYLMETGQLAQQEPLSREIPLVVGIIAGGADAHVGNKYNVATTFAQAEDMIAELTRQGVANILVKLQGWKQGGMLDSSRRFPVPDQLGGMAGLRKFAAAMGEQGIPVLLEDSFTYERLGQSNFALRNKGIRTIDTTIHQDHDTGKALLNPQLSVRRAKAVIDELERSGIQGIYYNDLGNTLFSDYAGEGLGREGTAYLYHALMQYTQEHLGAAGTERANSYMLGASNLVLDFPLESTHAFLIDETVPFYPLVAHGSVLYAGREGNLRDEYELGFLKAVEYGAIPFYSLTFARSRALKGTDYEHVFSSQFAIWKERIVEEYRQFQQLAPLWGYRMIRHEKQQEGVFVATYENGAQVIVDYNRMRFEVRSDEGE